MSIDSVLFVIRNTQKHSHPVIRLRINKLRDSKSVHCIGVKMNEF